MADRDGIVPLLPWYANGTLGPEERRQVERHLPSCARCRELLSFATALAEITRVEGTDRLLEHVQEQLLTEFADDRGALHHETEQWVRTHLNACSVCREAYQILEGLAARPNRAGDALPATGAVRERESRLRARLAACWTLLAGTLLRPLPALVYLTALLCAYPAYRLLVPTAHETTGGAETLRVVMLHGEPVYREPAPGPSAPAERAADIPAPLRPGGPVLLELQTGFDARDLADPSSGFGVRILDGDSVVASETRRGSDFSQHGVLPFLLFPDRLSTGRSYVLMIRLERPGDPRHGQILFRRSFRVPPPSP